ncbi:hypothetical protein [Pseudoclavibacter terrae]|uniref:ABC transporter n=1 Tax=Pseudoclavibacter terrae TaxID=1530195 RepID=A0A7J5B5N6_9MICO|nr:hypothetical protein [Pseudoclavibacter terrae]KAB1639489.1 hypothetical protein F8O03_03905 [Pseudoclavibacter terrae]
MRRRPVVAALAAVGMLTLAGCASPVEGTAASTESQAPEEQPHGFVAGAEELTEAQSSIASIGADGSVNVLNLLTGETTTLDSVAEPAWAVSDGRFVFTGSGADGDGITQVIDTGVWTVPHGDHVHYYRTAPGVTGELAEAGPARVSSDEAVAALSFQDSGTTVILDRHALGQGEVVELARVESTAHVGAAAPVGDAVVASSVESPGGTPTLSAYSLDGQDLGVGVECPGLGDVQQTSLGATFSCSDGLVFAQAAEAGATSAAPALTKVAYPDAGATAGQGAAPVGPASSLDNRPHRPAVAGPAGDAGIWLASSRTQELSFIPTATPILTAVAVADDSSRVVAVDHQGTLLVIDGATGEVTGTQAGLIGTPDSAMSIHLSVDTSRAYLSTPASADVHEIDYKDGARIARTLDLPSAPAFAFETGN